MRRLLSTGLAAVTICATAFGIGAAAPANAESATPSSWPSADWAYTARLIKADGNWAFSAEGVGVTKQDYRRFSTYGDAVWETLDEAFNKDPFIVDGRVPLVDNKAAGGYCWNPSAPDLTEDPMAWPFQGMTKPTSPTRYGQLDLMDGSSTVAAWSLVRNREKFYQPLEDHLVLDISGCNELSRLTGDYYIQGADLRTGSYSSSETLEGSDTYWRPVTLSAGPTPLSQTAAVTAAMLRDSKLKLDFSGLTDADRAALRQEGSEVTVYVNSLTKDDQQLTQEIVISFSDAPAKTPAPPPVVTVGDPGPGLVFDTGIGSASLGFWSTVGITLLGLVGASLAFVAVRDLRRRQESTRRR